MSNRESPAQRLERADLQRAVHEHALHNQLGPRLRSLYETPETRESAFDALLQRISTVLR